MKHTILIAADAEAWRSDRFPVTVTLNAAVPPPGAVLRIGDIPLVLRDPGAWTVWLPRSSAQYVRLCRQWNVPVDYTLSSSAPGFIFEPAGASAPQPPFYFGIRYEGVMAVPSPLTVEPTNACFHGKPVTFTAVGAATGLSGSYTWRYGYTEIVTNAPAATFAPDSGLPAEVTVSFMPRLAPPPQSGGFMLLSAGSPDWPMNGNGPCGYCGRFSGEHQHDDGTCDIDLFCQKTGSTSDGSCTNSPAYVPPANGTNTWGKYLAVNRRAPAPARPAGGTSFSPYPRGNDGHDITFEDPGPGSVRFGDHWHVRYCVSGFFDYSGCCDCPEHNGGGGGSSSSQPGPQPVILQSASGVTVNGFQFGGGAWPLSTGGEVPDNGGVYVTGQTPSASPLDRMAVFTREDPGNHETYHEYDRFTVMSLDLQPDVSCDGNFGSEDHSALALDWDRAWLIPATTNRWFPVKIFKDVALPGEYKVAVTGSSDITAFHSMRTVRGGEESVNVMFAQNQSEETVWIQAAAPGAATLTVTFTGTGAATNYNCSTYVSITAWGVEFFESAFTDYNFSPSLGEYGAFGVRIINAPADAAQQFDFKIEIVREIENNSEQHIDWVPVGNGSAAESRPPDFTSNRFDWDGISSVTYSSAVNGRDSFQGVAASAVRVFPAVTAGQPVPPPFVTAVAKIIRKSDSLTVCEARKRVCIPQVVKMIYDVDAIVCMREGLIRTNDGVQVTYISPMDEDIWEVQRGRIRAIAQAYYDATGANIRFVDERNSSLMPYSTIRMEYATGSFGQAPSDFPNLNPVDAGVLCSATLRDSFGSYWDSHPTMALPVTANEVGFLWALVAVHECGHLLGLVSPDVLNGSPGGTEADSTGWHNKDPSGKRIMNPGKANTLEQMFKREGDWSWIILNADYLRFILPKDETTF